MKKTMILIFILLLSIVLSSCSKKEKLYIINVGDYINKDLIEVFEEEFDCEIVYTEVNSNEEIYQKLKYENYDICVVSDYMIDRMYQEGLLMEIDYTKVPNYSLDNLFSDAKNIISNFSYKDYFIPYFWGTVGIMYNTEVEGLEDYIFENGLNAIFVNNEYNKGMYNSARDVLCLSLMSMGEDLNESDPNKLREAKDKVRSVTYRAWGDDNLKAMVHNSMIDMALVYSGDYYDELYQCETDEEEVNFNFFAPDFTNLWFDGLAMLKQGKNHELAYEFMNFMSDIDTQVENSDYIGYAPLVEESFNDLCDLWEYETEDKELFYPYGENRKVYKYVSLEHYNMLNDLLEEAKSK